MTEMQTPAVTERPRPARWKTLLLLTLVLALALAGWRVYELLKGQAERIQELSRGLNTLEAQVARLDTRQSDLAQAAQHNSSEIASFASRLDEYDQAAGKLAEQLQGGRVRFQLAAVEHLLLAGNERVQLEHDVRGAITALELADERLASLAEPRLFKLREAIAQERAALLAVPQADLTSAALTLSSLIARVPRLPLRARVPERLDVRSEHSDLPEGATWSERLWAGLKEALASVFTVRRNSGPAPQLLPPEQEVVVYQVLALKLEGARVAMLRGDVTSLRGLCDSASAWLRDYFRADDPNVLSAQAELERLKSMQLDPPLPDISRSLTLLRGYLDATPK